MKSETSGRENKDMEAFVEVGRTVKRTRNGL